MSDEPQMVARLRRRRAEYEAWSAPVRYAFIALGFLVLAAGVAMIALPGPAFVVIPVGLAMLSFEFAWAERLLERALTKAAQARRAAAEASPRRRLAGAIGTAVGVCTAAGVAAVVLL